MEAALPRLPVMSLDSRGAMCYTSSMSTSDRPPRGSAFYETPEQMEAAIEEYFLTCRPTPVLDRNGNQIMDARGQPVMKDHPPTVSGLALFLGFSCRMSIYDYEKTSPEFASVIGRARLEIESFHERLLSTKDKCTGSIFWLKNHGWIDERTLSGGSPFRVTSTEVKLSPEEEEAYKRNFREFFDPRGHADD